MTSKEVLTDISYLVLTEFDGLKNKKIWKSYFRQIKKDLEALEIIKKHKVNVYDLNRVFSSYKYNYFCVLEKYQELTEDEFSKLKEWLNNNK